MRNYNEFVDVMKGMPDAADLIKLTNLEGQSAFFEILKREPMSLQPIMFAGGANPILGAAVATSVIPPLTRNAEGQPVGFDFLEPARKNRLFQIRPMIMAISRDDSVAIGATIPSIVTPPPWVGDVTTALGAGINGLLVDVSQISPQHFLEWHIPSGIRRGGTNTEAAILINTLNNLRTGGSGGGRISFPQIYFRKDPSEVYDIWTVFGQFPSFGIINGSKGTTIGGRLAAQAPPHDFFDWFIYLFGNRFELIAPSVKTLQKLQNGELLPDHSIQLGGVATKTTR